MNNFFIIFTNTFRARAYHFDLFWETIDGVRSVSTDEETYIVADDSLIHFDDIMKIITPGSQVVALHHNLPEAANLEKLNDSLGGKELNCTVQFIPSHHYLPAYEILHDFIQLHRQAINP